MSTHPILKTVGLGLQAINPVTAVNRLRRRSTTGPAVAGELDEELIASQCKVQTSLTVKSCPSKNAPTTSALGVKSGFLMKRNAQGAWVNRFVCTVPHMFLYYFDGDSSDSPRGIIDMHLYNSLTIEGPDRNILKMSPPPEAGSIKPYYFQGDPELLNQWMTSIHRDRYEVVRDERDAYQQLQEQFSGEIGSVTKEFDASNLEKERLRTELAAIRSDLDEALLFTHSLLVDLGVGQNEVNQMSDLSSALSALRDASRGVSRSREDRERGQEQTLRELEAAVHSKEVLSVEAESRLAVERREWEIRSRELVAEIEKANMVVQNTSSEKTVVQQRNAKLGDEKKVLIKEVRQLRKRVEEMHEESALAVSHREAMEAKQSELVEQLHAAQQELQRLRQSLASASGIVSSSARIDEECGEADGQAPADRADTGGLAVREGTVVAVMREEDRDSQVGPRVSDVNQWEVPMGRIQDLVYLSSGAAAESSSSSTSSGNNSSSSDINSASSPVSSGGTASVFSGLMKSGFGMFGVADSGRTVTIATTLERQLLLDDRSSSGSGIGANDLPDVVNGSDATAELQRRTVGDAVDAANESLPVDGGAKLKCLRCDGTVEGPKYSTCTCRVPMLNLGFPAQPSPPAATQSQQGRWPNLGLMKLAKDIIPGVNGISEDDS